MADFPSTVPVDPTEISTYVRWWLGGLSTDILSEEDILSLVNLAIIEHGDQSPCVVTYYTTLSTLRYMIRQGAQATAGGAGGALIEREECEGSVKIREKYSEDAASSAASWDSVLEDLIENPSTIGCDPITTTTSTSAGSVIIGGADMNGVQATFRSRDKMGAAYYQQRNLGRRRLF